MRAIAFNDGWVCSRMNEAEEGVQVTVPHDAMLHEQRSVNAVGGKNAAWFEGHDYYYTKVFELPGDYAGKTVIFEFEGVYRNAEVYINGEMAGSRPYGYSNFYVDSGSLLKYGGMNRIGVVVRNADQPNSRWYSGAGIYRPVTMWVSDRERICLNGVKVRTLSCSTAEPAEIEVSVATVGEGEATVAVFYDEKEVASSSSMSDGKATFRMKVADAKLWSPEQPNLYICKATFGTDVHSEPFGIRTLEWGDDGMKMNGERILLRGACIHHDNGLLGAAAYADAEERKIRILKGYGYNAIRSAHNPCSKALLSACDRLGVMVLDEFSDCWYIHKTEYDYAEHFAGWWKQDLKDMVEKDFNHPCVVMYSTGNEVSETAQKKGVELTKELTEYLHGLDSSRPATCGINVFFNFLSSIGFGVYSDEKSRSELIKAEKKTAKNMREAAKGKAVKNKLVGSEFFNGLAGILGDHVMKMGATLPPCDWKTKDAFAGMDIAGYNYGNYRYRHDLHRYPHRLILGTETFCKDAPTFYRLAEKEPRLVGDFVWAGMDYLGEVGIGSWEYEDYAPDFGHGVGWISAGSGRFDLTGEPLAEAAYMKVAFGLTDKPVIAVRPVNHTNGRHSPSAWKMTNAMESWSWNGCDGNPAIVEVYSDAYAVSLYINGTKIGVKRMKRCCAVFKTVYKAGEILAIAHDEKGQAKGSNKLTTADEQTELRALPEKTAVKAGGLAYIRLQYTDEAGTVKPLERGDIRVDVQGGRLLALGNGCPYNPKGYLNGYTDTYYGKALAIVMATGECVTLTATDGRFSTQATVDVE
jgi:beta-galactosidase